jgi:hypothetical protein
LTLLAATHMLDGCMQRCDSPRGNYNVLEDA